MLIEKEIERGGLTVGVESGGLLGEKMTQNSIGKTQEDPTVACYLYRSR